MFPGNSVSFLFLCWSITSKPTYRVKPPSEELHRSRIIHSWTAWGSSGHALWSEEFKDTKWKQETSKILVVYWKTKPSSHTCCDYSLHLMRTLGQDASLTKKVFIIWYKDVFLCKRLLGLWNLYIMNKALKIQWQPESRTWRLSHSCVVGLTMEIQAVLYKTLPAVYNGCIWLHIYIKCKRKEHLQWGLKCFVTECKPTTTCWKPSRHLSGWQYGKPAAIAQLQKIYCITKCMKGLPICAIYWILQI